LKYHSIERIFEYAFIFTNPLHLMTALYPYYAVEYILLAMPLLLFNPRGSKDCFVSTYVKSGKTVV